MTSEHLTTRFEVDQPLIIISSISTAISVAIFILSMLDLGMMSLYLNPIVSGLTIVFHFVQFYLGRCHRILRRLQSGKALPPAPPSYSIASISCAVCLALLWIAPASVSIYEEIEETRAPGAPKVAGQHFVHGGKGTLIAQAVLAVANCIFVGLVAIGFAFGRRQRRLSSRRKGRAYSIR